MRAASEIKSKMTGVPDIVVNSAGITRDGYMLKMTEENYDAVLDVNLKGTWNVCKTFSQMMVDAKVQVNRFFSVLCSLMMQKLPLEFIDKSMDVQCKQYVCSIRLR